MIGVLLRAVSTSELYSKVAFFAAHQSANIDAYPPFENRFPTYLRIVDPHSGMDQPEFCVAIPQISDFNPLLRKWGLKNI